MSKKIKGIIQKELHSRFEDVKECIVVSIRGINGIDNNILRGDLKQKNIHLNVVKNSLARGAMKNLGFNNVESLLQGPCAVTFGSDDIVSLAKILVEWDKKLEHFQIRGGYLDGQVLNAQMVQNLSQMPSRRELQATVVMLAKSPGSRLAGAIGGPAGYIAGCVKALVKKLEEGSEAA
jgi:large subunit ribosomal protein L10